MKKITIYHNPRCSKSRQTLALIRDAGIEPVVVEYLEEGLNPADLKAIFDRMDRPLKDLVRRKEAKEEGMGADLDESATFQFLTEHPRALERPIVDDGTMAVLGRPPEEVQKLL